MVSLPFGTLILLAVLIYVMGGVEAAALFNIHSFVLVGIGTVGVLALSTPTRDIRALFLNITALRKQEDSYVEINEALIELGSNKKAAVQSDHGLIQYAKELWNQGIDENLFVSLLTQKYEDINYYTEQPVNTMRNLAKYPPGLGMTGTVIGLVALFSDLNPESKGQIGPMLAVAMTATFYGLLSANFFLMPLADRLYIRHLAHEKRNKHVYRVLLMIHQGEASSIIKDEVSAHAA